MSDAWPPSLKSIKPYVQRAAELSSSEPLVAHYCNLYALKLAIRSRDAADASAAAIIKSLLGKCEETSATFPDTSTHQATVESFALRVFGAADEIYASGDATADTARHFYAAMCFFDVCGNFGDLDEDLAILRKRARVYAALISRDVREGRQPVPPQAKARPGEDQQLADELTKSLSTGRPEEYTPPQASIHADSDAISPVVATTASGMYTGRDADFTETASSFAPPPHRPHEAKPVVGATVASNMYTDDGEHSSASDSPLERSQNQIQNAPPPLPARPAAPPLPARPAAPPLPARRAAPPLPARPTVLPVHPAAPPPAIAAWLDETSEPAVLAPPVTYQKHIQHCVSKEELNSSPSSSLRDFSEIPPKPAGGNEMMPAYPAMPAFPGEGRSPMPVPVQANAPAELAADSMPMAMQHQERHLAVAGYKPDLKAITEAQKKARWAVSALDWQDTETAVLNLNLALALLTSGSVPPDLAAVEKAPP